MSPPILLAVPNVSEGRSESAIAAIGGAFTAVPGAGGASGAAVRLLDVHSDADHHRSVYTLAGRQGELVDALLRGAGAAIEHIDVMGREAGDAEPAQHPHVGAIDVMPIVYVRPHARGAACAEALLLAERLAEELSLPVFLYGELSAEDPGKLRSRAQLRRGGVSALARRMAGTPGESARLTPDFGPAQPHPTAGATLVAARPPLVAFNLQLAPPATLQDAKGIAARVREGGPEGLPGLRAIAVLLAGGIPQVSMNVERPFELSLAEVVQAVGRRAELLAAELVGLAPAVALEGFPEDLPMPGFDAARHLIENALGCC